MTAKQSIDMPKWFTIDFVLFETILNKRKSDSRFWLVVFLWIAHSLNSRSVRFFWRSSLTEIVLNRFGRTDYQNANINFGRKTSNDWFLGRKVLIIKLKAILTLRFTLSCWANLLTRLLDRAHYKVVLFQIILKHFFSWNPIRTQLGGCIGFRVLRFAGAIYQIMKSQFWRPKFLTGNNILKMYSPKLF